MLIAIRQGSCINKNHSSPIAHCQALTSDLLRYSMGATPQPAWPLKRRQDEGALRRVATKVDRVLRALDELEEGGYTEVVI